MQDYINKIIKTGLENGATLEQMMANPEAAASSYLSSQLKALEKAEDQIRKEFLG